MATVPPPAADRSGSPPTMSKVERVADLLARRIANGDYLVSRLPGEQGLAAEAGVSYMTARKAVISLIDQGLIIRGENGRLMLTHQGGGRIDTSTQQVAFLAPAWPTLDLQRWRLAIERVGTDLGVAVKSYYFAHWDDPVLGEILQRGIGAFVYPSATPIPPAVQERLLAPASRVVFCDHDPSGAGALTIRLTPSEASIPIFEHLVAMGHRQIACLNVESHTHSIHGRLNVWREWTTAHDVRGDEIDAPVEPGADPVHVAIEMTRRWLRRRPAATALYLTTGIAAIGAMRAMHDAGVRPGRDIAVCTLNDEQLGALTIPSITALVEPDPLPLLCKALTWMVSGKPWRGSKDLRPTTFSVACRESTTWFGTTP